MLTGDACDIAGVAVSGSLVMDQHVITEWCQPLRFSKNAKTPKRQLLIGSFCVAGSLKVLKHLPIAVQKDLLDIRAKGGRLKCSHGGTPLRRGNSPSHLDTRVEGGAER